MIYIKKLFLLIKLVFLIIKIKKNYYKSNIFNEIRFTIEKLGPIFIKFGQILSTRTDLIKPEIITELKKLQKSTNFVKFSEMKKFFNKNIKIIQKLNENPIASASVAQIYTGILNNEKIIIKVLKPNITYIIKTDILMLKIISKIIHTLIKQLRRLKLIELIEELEKSLKSEINFTNDAINAIKIKANLTTYRKIYIPSVKIELTNENMIIMEYIDGINITNINKINKNKINGNIIIKNLLSIFYIQSLEQNMFHADMHPGNILISKNNINEPIIIFIDFGIIGKLTKKEKIYMSKNLLAFAQKKYKKVAKLHLKAKTINTKNTLSELEKDLYFIFDPISNKKIKNIPFEKILKKLITLSKKINIQTQPNLILFQKTLVSIESISRQIAPSTNLWETTRQSIEKIFIKNFIKNFIKKNTKKKNHMLLHNNRVKYKNINIIIYTSILILTIINILTYKTII